MCSPKGGRTMKRSQVALIALFVLALLPPCSAGESLCVEVVDGDSIKVIQGGKRQNIRLYGIDAPEIGGQPFGMRAKEFTDSMVSGKIVHVVPVTKDRYGRTVAWVYVDGKNLSHELLDVGLAWWFRKYAPKDTELGDLESRARAARRGIWSQSRPVPPWRYRRLRRK